MGTARPAQGRVTSNADDVSALSENERVLSALFEHSNVGMSITSPDKGWIRVNRSLERMLGYTEDELRSRTWTELTHPDDVDADNAQFARMLSGEIDGYGLDQRFIRKDGSVLNTLLSVTCLRTPGGDIEFTIAHLADTEERVKAERERDQLLHSQRERIKELRTMHGVAEVISNADDVPAVAALVVELLPDGMQYPEITGARISLEGATATTPLFAETPWMLSAGCPGIDESCQIQVCYTEPRPDADEGPFLAEERTLVEWVATALTEGVRRIRGAQAVLEQEVEFRGTFEQAAVGIAHVSTEGRFLRVNGRLAAMLGYTPEELMALDFQTITHPDDLGADLELVDKVLSGEIEHYSLEKRYLRKDGSILWINLTVGLVREDSTPRFFVSVIEDISERKSTQQAFEEKTEALEQFFNVTLDLLCVADASGHFLQLNAAWEAQLGYTRDELMAGRFFDFIHPDDIEATAGAVATLVGQQPVMSFTNRYRCRDGSYRWLDWRSAPVGELIYAVARDVTEEREAQEQLRQTTAYLESLISYANAPIIVWGPDGKVTRFNHAFERLTNMKASRVIGKDLSGLFPEETREASLQQIARAAAGESWESVEIPILRTDGTTRLALWNSANIYAADGETLMAVIAQGQDITARKAAEDALRELTRSLEDHIKLRTRALSASNAELEAFAYSVSHDLRAPLRSIDGFSRALEEDFGDKLDPQALDYLNRLRAASQRMAALIDDLLQLSRLTRNEMNSQKIDISALSEEILDQLAQSEPARHVSVEIAPGLHATGDPTLVTVALQNLLGNAWKFTQNVEDPRISVSGNITAEGQIEISVTDNGAGFDMAYVDKLFRPFQRLHRATEYPGTGIGLANVQRVAHRHGGRVWAVGEPGKGSTFSMSLPS
ncbi:MAG: PAS domain S-box protein [Actinobacteria bacterium]|nr:MAG: PAS domain S-box protein [Actinomycetota bacterium]